MGSLSIWHWMIILFGLAVYLIPSIVATARHHHNSLSILLLNIFFGWSGLGWIGALIWACTTTSQEKSK
jgi:hypothetical protein